MAISKTQGAEAQAVDIPALCRHGQALQGQWPLAQLTRLGEGLFAAPSSDDVVTWSAQGSLQAVPGSDTQLWLTLQVRTRVQLQCQRCLQPMLHDLTLDRRLRFVHDEAEAARLDEESEDDVLALQGRLHLVGLIEDELILALPLVPRHEDCSQPLPLVNGAPESAPEEAAHPFAALAALRRRDPN
ncbi:MAG TPA: YceD family protein [Rubrivivax sp.]|nr:YceD family protein [Rubrivivax sp.]